MTQKKAIPYLLSVAIQIHLGFWVLGGLGVGFFVLPFENYSSFQVSNFLLGVMVISVFLLQISCLIFYGDKMEKYEGEGKKNIRALWLPSSDEFYPTITADIGVFRKICGYLFAFTYVIFPISLGFLISSAQKL